MRLYVMFVFICGFCLDSCSPCSGDAVICDDMEQMMMMISNPNIFLLWFNGENA